jgi:hypothetical protein
VVREAQKRMVHRTIMGKKEGQKSFVWQNASCKVRLRNHINLIAQGSKKKSRVFHLPQQVSSSSKVSGTPDRIVPVSVSEIRRVFS